MSNVEKNDYTRSLLSKSLDELQRLEDSGELILSFSYNICLLLQRDGNVTQLLTAIHTYKINRDSDPFCDHRSGLFSYSQNRVFFKISHQDNTAYIEIGMFCEIDAIQKQRNNFKWYALEAVKNF